MWEVHEVTEEEPSLIFVAGKECSCEFWSEYQKSLEGILVGTKGGVFHGGTLCIGKYCTSVDTIGKSNAPDRVKYLVAKIYCDNKTPGHYFWDQAQEMIITFSEG